MSSSWSNHTHAIAAVGGSTTGYYPSAAGISTKGATAILAQIASASTSSAVVDIEQSVDGTVWTIAATITNPTLNGEMWALPAAEFVRLNLGTHASGTINAALAWRAMEADPLGREAKKIATSANSFGALSVTALTDSGLTAGRVPIAGSGGLLADDATLLFGSAKLTVPNLVDSGLTTTRVPYASTSGLLIDAAAFNYVTATGVLSAPIHAGGVKEATAVCNASEAIAVAPKTVIVTGATRVMTMDSPTATAHDGYAISFHSANASAHTLTVGAAGFNGDKNVATFSGALTDFLQLKAYQGVWYVFASSGITLSGS